MVKPKGLQQVLWEHIFLYTSKDVCTYYTIYGKEDYYGHTIIETGLREVM